MPKLELQNLRWLTIAVLVIILDQFSKHLVLQNFFLGESKTLLPILNFTLVFNPGAAFRFLGNAGSWMPWIFTGFSLLVSSILTYTLLRQEKSSIWTPIALSCIIGGALGNVWDRIQHGMVVDFIHVHYLQHDFPIFNLADSAICIGAAIMLVMAWKE